jgi:hypothetical protein
MLSSDAMLVLGFPRAVTTFKLLSVQPGLDRPVKKKGRAAEAWLWHTDTGDKSTSKLSLAPVK